MPAKRHNQLTADPEFDDLLRKSLDNSSNLEEVGANTLRLLMARRNVSMDYWDALHARFGWTDGTSSSLQHAADQVGLTRERIRQIQSRVLPLTLDLIIGPKVIYSVLGVIKSSPDLDSLFETLRANGLTATNSNWDIDELGELISIFGVAKLEQEFEVEKQRLVPVDIDIETRRIIQRSRNALGLIDLNDLVHRLGTNIDRAAEAVENVYQFTYRQNDLMLTTTRLPGMFLNTIGKQLLVSDGLSPEEILLGIERKTAERGTLSVGLRDDILELIVKFAGNPCRFENLPPEAREGSTLGRLEEWLKQVMQESTYGMLHRDQLSDIAMKEGVSLGSVGAFLTNSVVIRPVIPSIFTLVGNHPDKSTAELLKQTVVALGEATRITWEIVDSDTLDLFIIPNTAGFTSGSFLIEKELRMMIEKYEFVESCDCGDFETKMKLKVVPSKFWTGFSMILQHYRLTHGWTEGEAINIRFRFSIETAILKTN